MKGVAKNLNGGILAKMNQKNLVKMVAYEERAEGVRPAKQLRRDLKCGEANLSVVTSQFTD